MLYDILFIDDDFDNQLNLINLQAPITDLFLNLIRDNLRVTYTTGELDDLENLTEKDLSCVKYIICDLYLVGIKKGDSHKEINSKLINIFEKLWEKIHSEEVTILINSNNITDYGDEGISNLEKGVKSLNSLNFQYIKVEKIEEKNILSEKTKKELLRNNLEIHVKSLIISKAVEVEKALDRKLKINEKFIDVITFDNKFSKLKSFFSLNKHIKIQIMLLQQIRNKVAHTNNALNEIQGKDERKEFWDILKEKQYNQEICFENFADLMKYINSISNLVDIVNKAKKKSPNA